MAKSPDNTNSSGLTLIGVIVATFIIVVAIILMSRIMATNNKVGRLSQQKFVAAALAREGLELIQAQRDQNWFNTDSTSWTDQLCSDAAEDTNTLTIDLDEYSGIFIDDADKAPLYQTPAGEWTHNSVGNTPTPYSRQITVDCANINPADPLTASDYIEVTSTVTWDDQEVSLKTRLFNWYVPPA